jgi:hypothetical protein
VFILYAVLLGIILLAPWSGWFVGAPLKLFRDYVDLSDWREDIPFAAILVGLAASIAALVRGRFYPAVPAVVGGAMFLGVGSMSFGAFPSLIGILNGGEAKACAVLLCLLAAGARCARKRRGGVGPLRLAGGAGALLTLVAGATLLYACLQGRPARQQAFATVFQVPPAFGLWGLSVSHSCAVIASGALVLAALVAAGFASHARGGSRGWPSLAEAMAKGALLVSPAYALARALSAPGQADFADFLRFRWELASAIFLFLLIDGLAEVIVASHAVSYWTSASASTRSRK